MITFYERNAVGTRLVSNEPPDTVCACLETVIIVWLCVQGVQEHVWALRLRPQIYNAA